MRAIGKNIIIQPIKQGTTKTKGGLILSETHKKDIRYREASVHSVGDTVVGIKKNNTIFYDRHAGHWIEIKKQRFMVIKEGDVVIVL
jgi:co-chaperonin GroES (HSP10)